MRLLIVLSAVIFGVSAALQQWKLGIAAIVVMIVAQVYGLVTARRDTSGDRLRELLKPDDKTKP
jgi:hypothetical protein